MSAPFTDPVEPVLVPDVAEPLRGFRSWKATGFALEGTRRQEWPVDGPMTAECVLHQTCFGSLGYESTLDPPEHECPSLTGEGHAGHGCGIYAYRTAELLAAHQLTAHQVFGEVEMWGRVMPHTDGYRAQFARIVRLFVMPDADDDVAERAALVYGVPCEPFPLTAEEMAALKPRTVDYTFTILWTPPAKDPVEKAAATNDPTHDVRMVDRWAQSEAAKADIRAKFRRLINGSST